jgi:hypothetical protein
MTCVFNIKNRVCGVFGTKQQHKAVQSATKLSTKEQNIAPYAGGLRDFVGACI